MRTIIDGPVTLEHLSTAELFGVEPTSYVTNGLSCPPFSPLSVDVQPVDLKLGTLGLQARNYSMCQSADALVCIGGNPHLVNVAQQYGLTIFEA